VGFRHRTLFPQHGVKLSFIGIGRQKLCSGNYRPGSSPSPPAVLQADFRKVWLDITAIRALPLQQDVQRQGYIVALPDRHYSPFHAGDISNILWAPQKTSVDGQILPAFYEEELWKGYKRVSKLAIVLFSPSTLLLLNHLSPILLHSPTLPLHTTITLTITHTYIMSGYSHYSHFSQKRSPADQLKVKDDTLEIPVSDYMSEDGQARCATDFGKELSKALPQSEVTFTPGKISVHIPGADISVKGFQHLPETVEGSVGALKVSKTMDKYGIDLAFVNTPEDSRTHRSHSRHKVTAYVNTEVNPVGRKPYEKLEFSDTKQGLDDKFTAESGLVSQTRDEDHGYVATSFVPESRQSGYRDEGAQ
jgi:hypothetical protein